MKRILLTFLVLLNLAPLTQAQQQISSFLNPSTHYFLENIGQVLDQYQNHRDDIDFQLKSINGLSIFIGNNEIHYQWNQKKEDQNGLLNSLSESRVNSYRMDVSLIGANPNPKLLKEEHLPYYEQYYSLNLKGTIAASFQKITYLEVYPHIDWVLYFNRNNQLEYDFIVRPGGRVEDIQLEFKGSTDLDINTDGSLSATTPMGRIKEKAPFSFQSDGKEVKSNFVLKDNILSFYAAAYQGALTIDPTLEWASYYGGSGSDYGRFVACDQKGGVYLTGSSESISSNIATIGAHQITYGGGTSDALLVKFDSSGARLWATYFGGTGNEQAWSVTCDESNNVYVAGQTSSASEISKNGYQSILGGKTDAFLAKFNTSGVLQWSTYYGGTENDEGWSVVSDKKGHIYFAGRTFSPSNISTPNAHQQTYDNLGDAFLVKFDTAGVRLWGTYYGGPGIENTWALSCDKAGNVYISGETASNKGIATSGAHQTVMTPSLGSEAFLGKFNDAGVLQWGTYYGGNQSNQVFGSGIACDDSGYVYMVGYTTSSVDVSTLGSHQQMNNGGYDAFLVKFSGAGKRQWGTYYGGEKIENGYGVACDEQGNVYITGYSNSIQSIATSDGIQITPNNSNEFFVAKFNRVGVRQWGTYYGGNGYDAGFSLAHDLKGNLYVTGFSNSPGIATANGYQTIPGGGFDAFLFKISECFVTTPAEIIGPDSICPNTTHTFKVPSVTGASSYTWQLPPGWTGSSNVDSIVVTSGENSGSISVTVYNNCDTSQLTIKDISVFQVIHPVISVDEFELGTVESYTGYQWLLNDMPINGGTNRTYKVTRNGDYRVIINTENGCIDTSDSYSVTNVTNIKRLNSLEQQIVIYPNPANDIIYINSPVKVDITLLSIEGKIIKKEENALSIQVSELNSGLYFLRVLDKGGNLIKVEKLIIDK